MQAYCHTGANSGPPDASLGARRSSTTLLCVSSVTAGAASIVSRKLSPGGSGPSTRCETAAASRAVRTRVSSTNAPWSARAALGEQTFAEVWAVGRTMSLEQLITEVLAALKSRPLGADEPTGQRSPRSRGLLSRREQEVLPLVAEGLTNQEIGERLVISPSTAKYHLSSLLNKLGAENRTQAVLQARQHGLL